MNKVLFTRQAFWFLAVVICFSCTKKNYAKHMDSKASEIMNNPLLMPWKGPYNGVPPFDQVRVEDFIPAVEMAMAEKRNEIDKIVNNPASPDFINTIEALEKTGNSLKRVLAIYSIWTSNMSNAKVEEIQSYLEPRFASFQDSIVQNSKLFNKIETVQNSSEKMSLNPEQKRLLWRYHTSFVLAGAKLNEKDKARVAEINKKLAELFAKFNQHLLADESGKYMEIKTLEELDGVPKSSVNAAAQAAESKGKKGSWIISNTRSAIEPFLTYCNNRSLREKAWRMFINRGDNGDANDNNALIPEILLLRAERAKIMGYPTHAHLKLADKMAQTPEKAMALLESVWPFAIARVAEEVADMQNLADKAGDKIKIEAWDYRYYAEKVRKLKFDLDQSEVKEYLQLEKLREGMFFVAGELFNMKFEQVYDVPVFHPDVRVFKVLNKVNNELIGLWYFDPYARSGKRSGAWMNAYREQETINGKITTIVSNNCNFLKGQPGEPVLISWIDAETLFHEFGHALHGLCSKVNYPTLSGTNVATDYVEFPSQILERWLSTPEILENYALHYKTGKPMPKSLLDKINNASKFNQGFSTVEYLASALIDMKLHLAGDVQIDPDKFERETLEAMRMPKEMVMRHRTPQFGHIFSDDGYSAGYYSYLWSDVLSSDAYEAFTEAKGPYDHQVAERLYKYVFSIGGTMDEAEAYKKFRGKDPSQKALMVDRGFTK